ncbi:glycosyltransferase, partial [Saprospiraceae bacterium]|nr:glycosyltransferase [Saprospiraceae bacterium]
KENTIQQQTKYLAHYDFRVRELTLDGDQKEKLIDELKSSITHRIGLFLTAPFRGTYEFFKKIRLAKFFLWLKFIPIILLSPLAFFASINKRNLYTLKHALKNEDARTIYRNFISLLKKRKTKTNNDISFEQNLSKPEESKPDFGQKPLRGTVENIHSDFKHIQGSILFISHDAGLAGAQMILIHLMEWFAKHTNVDFKLLTLQDGPLLERFNNICPTLRWSQVIAEYPEFTKRHKHLGDWIGKVELIYGNTTVAPGVYDELAFLKAPFLTHVHELEISIQKYVSEHAQKNMHKYTDAYVACSNPVADNLNANHYANEKQLITIHEFIDDYPKSNTKFRKKKLRSELKLEQDKFLVISCGNIYWRKGFDLFIETAVELLKLGETNFHFYWIGDNSWDDSAHPKGYPSWDELLTRMESTGVNKYITILGIKEIPRDYFLACDAFYLPAREDPYPLVCLEAAQCALPIICFKEAGGMPDFVENDAGFSVPFEEFKETARKIEMLILKPKLRDKLGATAKDKLENNHTVDSTVPKIVSFIADNFSIFNIDPAKDISFTSLISVIIPTKNAGDEFEINLRMIRNQKINGTIEIVIVDSGSTDNTIAIANSFGCSIINIKPEEFSHSYARNLGVDRASGKYLFITVQDATLPDIYFFQNMLDKLENNQLDALSCAEEPRANCDLFYKVISENHYNYLGVVKKDVLFHKPSNINDANEVRKNGQLSDIALLIPKNIMTNYKYRGDYAEDLDLGIRMVNDGRRVMFTGNLAVVHSHVRSAYYFLKRAFVDTKSVNKILSQSHNNIAFSEIVRQLKTALSTINVLTQYVIYVNNNFETFDKKIPKPSEFMGKAQLEAESFSENVNVQFIDEDLTSFLLALQSYVNTLNGENNLKDKLNIQGFTHLLDSIHETAMISTNNISSTKDIDLTDYIQSLYKGYSLLLGSQLSFIYSSYDTSHELKELLVNLSDEV